MMEKKIIIIILLSLIIGGFIGCIIGYRQGVSDCVDIGITLLNTNNANITVNPELIKYAVILYHNKAKLIIENAPISIR